MSKIEVHNDMAMVDNNGRAVVYDYAHDVVIIPAQVATVEGDKALGQCEAVIANGREFLASCTALYGCFSVKAMEE